MSVKVECGSNQPRSLSSILSTRAKYYDGVIWSCGHRRIYCAVCRIIKSMQFLPTLIVRIQKTQNVNLWQSPIQTWNSSASLNKQSHIFHKNVACLTPHYTAQYKLKETIKRALIIMPSCGKNITFCGTPLKS